MKPAVSQVLCHLDVIDVVIGEGYPKNVDWGKLPLHPEGVNEEHEEFSFKVIGKSSVLVELDMF